MHVQPKVKDWNRTLSVHSTKARQATSAVASSCTATDLFLASTGLMFGSAKVALSLHAAAAAGDAARVESLLEAGADAGAGNDRGWTPMYVAAHYGHVHIIKILAGSPIADVNAPNSRGWTPLHVAVVCGHDDVVDWLVSCGGADVDAVSVAGETPLILAAKHNRTNMIDILQSSGKEPPAAWLASGSVAEFDAPRAKLLAPVPRDADGAVDVAAWVVKMDD